MASAVARIAFLPSLLYNVLLEKASLRRWYDRIDQTVVLGALPFRGVSRRLVETENVRGVITMNEEYETRLFCYTAESGGFLAAGVSRTTSEGVLVWSLVVSWQQVFREPQARVCLSGVWWCPGSRCFENHKRGCACLESGGVLATGVSRITNDGVLVCSPAVSWPQVLRDLPATEWQALGVEQLRLSTVDLTGVPTQEHLQKGVKFALKHQELGHSVYIHCKAGRSRSATMAAAYLIQVHNWSPHEAKEYIKNIRPQTLIRRSQFEALEQFHAWVRNQSPVQSGG
ncbi:phosphatidylglycerophosphatase and protein-tyrosine phosphatase 1 isoform X1 [Pleurodeles waltl]|uniref:phosphatidylglycerophosphatase and protein-tyrosine phosphatase 1 isoform X1 n=1 Tax=Pleurodeles waltl TaxID=8319 RepID=UPI0037096DFD